MRHGKHLEQLAHLVARHQPLRAFVSKRHQAAQVIGYNKAARLVEQMEEQGLVSPANHVGKREILVPEQE